MRRKQSIIPKILFILIVLPFAAVVILGGLNFCCYVSSRPDPDAIDQAEDYARKHGLRTDRVILCDFSRHSGVPRFWIYNCDTERVIRRSLCAHGCGDGNTSSQPKFSNAFGSRCSSVGMYRIEGFHKMKGRYRSLKLKGLSSTNSNAERRGILIHSGRSARHYHFGMYPFHIPLSKESEGCFSVSDGLLTRLIKMTRESDKKLLLYAYYD